MRGETRSFDYIVVGGGSAGCVVAARLVAAGATVCLLEAGSSNWHPLFHMPAGYGKVLGEKKPWLPQAHWGYFTAPQTQLEGRALWFPQAKVLGGGSSINAMIYNRGHASDYDRWAELGAEGWAYSDVLPYFRKAETNLQIVNQYHGSAGPLRVSSAHAPLDVTRAFVAAAGEAGVPFNPDFNGAVQAGAGLHQRTLAGGRRMSTAVAYLKPLLRSPNFTLVTGAVGQKIVFSGRRAVGIDYRRGRSLARVHATQEVILTSGAIGTPKLLLLSGLGPADHLKSAGVPIVADMPGIGSNLQDHFDCYLVYDCSGPHTYHGGFQPLTEFAWGLRYYLTRSGPLASNFVEAGAFVTVDPSSASPDVQLHLLPAYVVDSGRERIRGYGISLYTNMLRPRSRGTVRLSSADAAAPPVIDPNFLADPYDMKIAVGGLKRAREVMQAPALRPYIAAERMPGPDTHTEAELSAYVKRIGKTDYHPVGTCRMGMDSEAVVDPLLRLNGFERLRVVDASVMPTVVSGNTNAPTIMIGEKGADMILGAAGASSANRETVGAN